MRKLQVTKPSFEETYPHYPCPELVRLAIAVGRWLARWRGGRIGVFHGQLQPVLSRPARRRRDAAARDPRKRDDLAA